MPAIELTEADFIAGCADILSILQKSGLCPSKAEARRTIEQGGVEVNGEKITSFGARFTPEDCFGDGIIVRRGKKNFRRIVYKS